jgi:hypothetical protein
MNKECYTLPAGKYFIGDPCYVFPNDGPMSDKWQELLEAGDYFETCEISIDDGKIKVWAGMTVFGDGTYLGSNGKSFPVDSGLIGIVPMETVEYLGAGDLSRLGVIVEYNRFFGVAIHAGIFNFPDFYIDTGPVDEDD